MELETIPLLQTTTPQEKKENETFVDMINCLLAEHKECVRKRKQRKREADTILSQLDENTKKRIKFIPVDVSILSKAEFYYWISVNYGQESLDDAILFQTR